VGAAADDEERHAVGPPKATRSFGDSSILPRDGNGRGIAVKGLALADGLAWLEPNTEK
jgi:hypothetical protein